VEICDEYAGRDKRIIVIHTEALGISAARNTGLEQAAGDYISFIDADDYVAPDFIEELYRICTCNNTAIAQCDFLRVEKDISAKERITPNIRIYSGVEMCYNLYNDLMVTSVVVWSKLYRRGLFADIQFPVNTIHEDEAVIHKLFYHTDKIGVTDQKLYYYRCVETSMMNSPYTLKRLDHITALENRMKFFQDNNETHLYSFTRLSCLRIISYNIKNITAYIPDSVDIQEKLRSKRNRLYWDVVSDTNISLRQKAFLTLVCYLPGTIKFLVKIKSHLRGQTLKS
jgi:glycosyltransferase involved in cell wall biosynthesis